MVYILNFTVPRDLIEIKNYYDKYGGTNINFIQAGFSQGKTNWSVPKKSTPGDIAVFMCAKTAKNNIGSATSQISAHFTQDFRSFIQEQKNQYKMFSGYLLGYGFISSEPKIDDESGWWKADITQLKSFTKSIYIDDFRSFISISRTNSITPLNNNQWERLKWLVNQKNPGFFMNAVAPGAEILEKEFIEAVHKEESKSLSQLKKEAEKINAAPNKSVVQTTTYYRNPTVAAYVKKRANGFCQLCGTQAPFKDTNGEPYLECHHIVFLSEGGLDSPENCVALCPNCHRRMHVLSDQNDMITLKTAILHCAVFEK